MRRKLIRILIALVILFVLAGIAVKVFISPEAVKEFVFAELETRTGIHAEAEHASIQFPWPVGLRLEGLRLSTPEAGPEEFRLQAEVEEALATADLMSLIRKEPQVQEVRLSKPHLELWLPEPEAPVDETGASAAPGVVEPPAEQPAAGVALALSLLSIDEGRIVLHRPDGSVTTLEGLRQRVRFQIDAQQQFHGRIESSVDALRMEGGGREAPLQLGEVEIEALVEGSLEPLRIEATLPRLRGEGVEAEGDVGYELREEKPHLRADLQWTMDSDALLARVHEAGAQSGDDPLAGYELGLESLAGTLSADGFLPQDTEDPKAWLALLSVEGNAEGIQLGAYGRSELVSGRTGFRLDGDSVLLEPLELRSTGLQADGQLRVPALGAGEMRGSLSLEIDAAELEGSLADLWPALPESLTADATPPQEWPQISGDLEGELVLGLLAPPPDELPADAVAGVLRVTGLTVVQETMAAPLRIQGGTLRFDLEKARIEGLRLATEGLEGAVDGVLDGWPDALRFVGEGAFAEVDLDRLQPQEKGEQSRLESDPGAWWQPATARAAEEPEAFVPPENLTVQMGLRADRLLTRGYLVQDMSCRADLHQRVLELSDLEGRLGSGRVVGEATVDWSQEQPEWKTRVEAIEIPAASLLEPIAPRLAQALQTNVNGMLQMDALLTEDRSRMLQSLTGGGALKGSAGELITTVLLGESLDSLPGDAAQKLRSVPFQDFLTSLRFDGGKAHFDETVLRGPTQVRAEGWAGFDGKVDYQLEVKLPPGEKLDLGNFTFLTEFLRADDGRITIPIHVSGPGTKPKISLQLDAAEERAKDAAKDDLQDKVKGLLKGLGGKKGGG